MIRTCFPAVVGGFHSLAVFALVADILNMNPHDIAGSQKFPSAKTSLDILSLFSLFFLWIGLMQHCMLEP